VLALAVLVGPSVSQTEAPADSAGTTGEAEPEVTPLATTPADIVTVTDSTDIASPSGSAPRDSTGIEIPPQPIDVEADRLIGSRGPEGEVVLLEGNVVLRQGTTVIRSLRGRWVTAQRSVHLTGGVQANDGSVEITADQADYHERSELIVLTGNVHVVDTNLDATSEFGSYDAQTRRAELWGNVRAVENDRVLTCERAIYHRDTGRAEAMGNVQATDSTGTTVLVATFVDYDRDREVARAFGDPKLTRSGGGRDIVLTADTLIVDNAAGVAHAIGDVHVDRDTLQATAGRAMFWDRENRGVLLENPRVWNDEITATGDSIEYILEGGDLVRAAVKGGVASTSPASLPGPTASKTCSALRISSPSSTTAGWTASMRSMARSTSTVAHPGGIASRSATRSGESRSPSTSRAGRWARRW
jgi:lipopolysaccharide export system protein LptA